MSGRVTDSGLSPRPCRVCGEPFTPTRRSNAWLCGPACKQRAYRRRKSSSKAAAVTLSARDRARLRDEVARRTLALEDQARAEADRELAAAFEDQMVAA